MSRLHFEVILCCLLPHPPEYARVGGYWWVRLKHSSSLNDNLPTRDLKLEVHNRVVPLGDENVKNERDYSRSVYVEDTLYTRHPL